MHDSLRASLVVSLGLGLPLVLAVRPAAADTVALSTGGQYWLDADQSRNLIYAGEQSGPGGTHYFDVIDTTSNTVVGTYSYAGSGYSAQIAHIGNHVFWADQGHGIVRNIDTST